MFTFSEMLALVHSETVKAVSVPTSVIGGLQGSTATSDLVRCMCVYVCVSLRSLGGEQMSACG